MNKVLGAAPVLERLKEEINRLQRELGTVPTLGLAIGNNNTASSFYVKNIVKNATANGIKVVLKEFGEDVVPEVFYRAIRDFAASDTVHAIMVQKPLPCGVTGEEVNELIPYYKDADGFHPRNLGNILLEKDGLTPCTAAAVLAMIEHYQLETCGKHAVILGRSSIVGKPLANMLLSKKYNATVSVCHSKTQNLSAFTKEADLLIAAIGHPRFVKAEMLSEGAIVLDVGINRIEENGKKIYVGDVDYDACLSKVAGITPVPGGIGSITTLLLLRNVMKATIWQQKNS